MASASAGHSRISQSGGDERAGDSAGQGKSARQRVEARQPPRLGVGGQPKPPKGSSPSRGNSQSANRPSSAPVGMSMKWCCQVVSTEAPIRKHQTCQTGRNGPARRVAPVVPDDDQQRDVQRRRLVERLVEAAEHGEQEARQAAGFGPHESRGQRKRDEAGDGDELRRQVAAGEAVDAGLGLLSSSDRP